jgi:7-cyano-7-deazaguanine tRNA-ribosyltransferase
MRDHFEVRTTDAGGRVGELTVPRSGVTVETPALMPVVNPNVQTVEPARLASEFGADVLITNSYIIKSTDDLREAALEEGLHDLLGFDGAIVTDSGSFQLAEYGEIDVTTEEILRFQHAIGSDVGTPVDVPTPPDVARERAESELATTEERLAVAADVDTGEMLVNAPVQGSTYPDLREAAGAHAAGTDLDVFPVGAVVPLLNDYRYGDVVEVVRAAKRGLGPAAPVHLFGAGHPMTFALAAALGCDLFDSAAYALYARDGRYLTVRGTKHLDEMHHLPCSCPVCSGTDAETLQDLPDDERREQLAVHNLHVTFGEIRRVKAAIRSGELLELVDARARSHPSLLSGYRCLLDDAEQLAAATPIADESLFYVSGESARWPAVARHHDRLARVDTPEKLLLSEGVAIDRFEARWSLVPPFGPVPPALSKTAPLTAVLPERLDEHAYRRAADGVAELAAAHPDTELTVAHDDWPTSALARLPEDVTTLNLDDDD